jgi:hypothetical protein
MGAKCCGNVSEKANNSQPLNITDRTEMSPPFPMQYPANGVILYPPLNPYYGPQ